MGKEKRLRQSIYVHIMERFTWQLKYRAYLSSKIIR